MARKSVIIKDGTLTIDPGDHTGWAMWRLTRNTRKNVWLSDYGIINLSRAKNIQSQMDQLSYMWNRFDDLLDELNPFTCYIEGTKLWEKSLKSMTAAKRGDIFKLSYLIGGYCCICKQHGIDVELISANDWKGQAKDAVIATKVYEHTGVGLDEMPQHTLDAIGIGLAGFGLLERKQLFNRSKRSRG